ncbi:hypothetical protein [Saccharopolyspora griseoalba]|uniref:Uncharacterized protein n=1 Tax=Saccharopolyspora griseoalba TaxID=1431848 RepID=A0ABW2LFD6_9PSEU
MASGGSGRTAGAFDIRTVIALLFAIYGVVLVAVGLVEPQAEIAKSAGVNINLWGGVGMLAFAAVMVGWARLRPIVVPDEADGDE